MFRHPVHPGRDPEGYKLAGGGEDANARRRRKIFAALFALLVDYAHRGPHETLANTVYLIDATVPPADDGKRLRPVLGQSLRPRSKHVSPG